MGIKIADFIELIKGCKIKNNPPHEEEFFHETLLFSFRDKKFEIDNLESKESYKPYLGARLNIESAKLLIKWLQEVIDCSRDSCDECYNFKLPKNFAKTALHCKACGNDLKILE